MGGIWAFGFLLSEIVMGADAEDRGGVQVQCLGVGCGLWAAMLQNLPLNNGGKKSHANTQIFHLHVDMVQHKQNYSIRYEV